MDYMDTMRLVDTISFQDGKLYGKHGEHRLFICEGLPLVKIYKVSNYPVVLNKITPEEKAYYIGTVSLEDPKFAQGIDSDRITRLSSYELKANILLYNSELREYIFRDLAEDYRESGWVLTTEEQPLLKELLEIIPY